MTDWVPPACTLPTAEQPFRMQEFDELFRSATAVHRVDERQVRLALRPDPAVVAARAAELAMHEAHCCSFFRFTLTVADGGLTLAITVPAGRTAVIDGLVGRAAESAGAVSS